MGVVARMKSKSGGSKATPTYTPITAVDFSMPETSDVVIFEISSSVTIPTICANLPIHAGRTIVLIGDKGNLANSVTLTNNNSPTKGQMDLGGSDVSVGATDVVQLTQRPDGSWVESSALVNN